MNVQKKQCNECLFGRNKIVSDSRRRQIIKGTIAADTYFNCHKGTIAGRNAICCRGFWDAFKDRFNLGRIVQRLGGPRWVNIK